MQLKHLALDAVQLASIESIYQEERETCLTFTKDHPEDQSRAQDYLTSLGLDREAREALESRWSVQWSTSWDNGKGGDKRRRILFQWYIVLFVFHNLFYT